MDTTILDRNIDVIERGYEHLLAFAAQGRRDDASTDVRATLESMHVALAELEQKFSSIAAARYGGSAPAYDDTEFLAAAASDARRARGAIAHVLNSSGISSMLVDNLNASVHLRTLLTDLFLVDQAKRRD